MTSNQNLKAALRELMRAYVGLLEAARERIIFHGGTCDSVETMERSDPYLKRSLSALNADETSSCIYDRDGDSNFFDTGCGKRWHLTPGLELYPHCAWCGKRVAEKASCVCGSPDTPGIAHRQEGPCFVIEPVVAENGSAEGGK